MKTRVKRILLSIVFTLALVATFFVYLIYSSKWLLNIKSLEIIREKIDSALSLTYNRNFFWYRSFYNLRHPGFIVWRPTRLISSGIINGQQTYKFYGIINNWDSEQGLLSVSTYSGRQITLDLNDTVHTSVVYPDFSRRVNNVLQPQEAIDAKDLPQTSGRAEFFCENDIVLIATNHPDDLNEEELKPIIVLLDKRMCGI